MSDVLLCSAELRLGTSNVFGSPRRANNAVPGTPRTVPRRIARLPALSISDNSAAQAVWSSVASCNRPGRPARSHRAYNRVGEFLAEPVRLRLVRRGQENQVGVWPPVSYVTSISARTAV